MDEMKKIAFLGTGLMGFRLAKRLLDSKCSLVAWNRTRSKAQPLEKFGALVVEHPREAVENADVIFLSLENGHAVEDVLFKQIGCGNFKPGSIVIDTSSISPAEAVKVSSRLEKYKVAYIDAPVSGGTVGAENGELTIFVGGEFTSFKTVETVLRLLGEAVYLGPVGSGQLVKLANQIIVGATIGAVSEAMFFIERGGADIYKSRQALLGGFAQSRVLAVHGERIANRDFTTKGRSVTHLKDLKNATLYANEVGSYLPYTNLTSDLFEALIENHGDIDHSALILELERTNINKS